MSLWGSFGTARRLLVELRGIRRALERSADAQAAQVEELRLASTQTSQTRSRYSFRSWTEIPITAPDPPLPEPDAPALLHRRDSEVMLAAQQAVDDLRPLLGRDPTEDEIWQALEERDDLAGRLR